MKFSLRTALAGLWALILALCGALAFLMLGLFEGGVGAQLRQGNERLDQAATETARRFERYRLTFEGQPVPLTDPQTRADLEAMLDVALAPHPGVEGGLWRGENASLAYAFPTHDGPKRKRDLPQAELGQIRQVIQGSLTARAPLDRRFDGERASLLLHAQPVPGPPPDLALWTMTRAPLAVGKSYQRLASGLGYPPPARVGQRVVAAAPAAALDAPGWPTGGGHRLDAPGATAALATHGRAGAGPRRGGL